ncbi:MAG TPA: tripartite tricarboxylate transporter substrate binding protein [Ramlibacter sp.]|nr:tripartite tricarboxylate transporter substrate binding protein [Ramlibacter sp.]
MQLSRRTVVVAALTSLASGVPLAQPAGGTIKIVVPFPPGQGADVIIRIIADPLSRRLGQPVIVENRPGAGGALGTTYALQQPADGLTLFQGSSGTLSISPTLQPQAAKYNPLKDAEPITGVASVAQAFMVPANSPIKDLRDLIARAKQSPGKLTYGSSGNGTTQHLFMESFAHAAGIKLLHVPYKGNAPAFNDLMGGQINLMSDTIPAVLPHVKGGTVRALAVTSSKRFPGLPDVPAVSEVFKGWHAEGWISVMAPAGLPAATADRIDKEIRAVMREPEVAKKIRDMGFVEMDESRGELRGFIQSELAKWKAVIDVAGIKVE